MNIKDIDSLRKVLFHLTEIDVDLANIGYERSKELYDTFADKGALLKEVEGMQAKIISLQSELEEVLVTELKEESRSISNPELINVKDRLEMKIYLNSLISELDSTLWYSFSKKHIISIYNIIESLKMLRDSLMDELE